LLRTRGSVNRGVADRIFNTLFLCTGNSARSIMAEAVLNSLGKGRFNAYSAGSHPRGKVHPVALELIGEIRLPVADLHSKSWDEFTRPGAPRMAFVITVCDNAAGEVCPVWPGRPMTAHWGIPDPALASGTIEEQRQAFVTAFSQLRARVGLLVNLPFASLDRLSLQRKLEEIGKIPD